MKCFDFSHLRDLATDKCTKRFFIRKFFMQKSETNWINFHHSQKPKSISLRWGAKKNVRQLLKKGRQHSKNIDDYPLSLLLFLTYFRMIFRPFSIRYNFFCRTKVEIPSSHVRRLFFFFWCICVCCTFLHSKQWSAITQTVSKSLTNYQLWGSLFQNLRWSLLKQT